MVAMSLLTESSPLRKELQDASVATAHPVPESRQDRLALVVDDDDSPGVELRDVDDCILIVHREVNRRERRTVHWLSDYCRG